MALINLSNAQLAFGHLPLLDNAEFSLQPDERIGLIGRNGSGKSSLLKILAGKEQLDHGELQLQQNLQIAYVAQEPILDAEQSVFEALKLGVANILDLIEQYSQGIGDLDQLQTQIETQDGWNWQQRVDECLEKFKLDGNAKIATLSGGLKKRVGLAQALISKPDVLLLDEPTNHLDLDSITWLEELLLNFSGSCIIITHDRSFLNRVANRILELDRGKLRGFPGNYEQYLLQKEQQLQQESVINAKADKLLAQEEVWIRKGVEARRTKSQSRIERLKQLRTERQDRREVVNKAQLKVSRGDLSGKIVAELENVSKAYANRSIVRNFSTTILRGDKVGLLGHNGAGKTTLLKLILGEIQPDSGKINQGSNLQIAYFDQMREQLNLEETLESFISPSSEWVEINGQRKHVKSYLNDFLFPSARAHAPIKSLSGGERNRLLLARLFARPANVLVLDEPTNDLDIETLELLEELLQNYPGTVFLVSHDRTFLNNVVTSIIASEADGNWCEYEGNVDDWLLQSQRRQKAMAQNGKAAAPPATPTTSNSVAKSNAPVQKPRNKLSYKEQRELDELPQKIEQLEQEQLQIQQQLADGSIFSRDHNKAISLTERSSAIEEQLLQCLDRWEQLSE